MVLKIIVKTLDSQNYQFEAQEDWTVSQFKDHIKDTVNVAPEEQRLIFCGRVLQNDKKLIEYDCHEKVMHLVRRPPPSVDEPERRSSTNENTLDDSGASSRAGSFRFGEGHDILLSTMTLGPDGSINDLWRQIVSLQQTIHANNRVIDEERATLASNLGRLSAEVDRRLNNLGRLTRMTTAQIAECYSRISQINSSGSSIPRPIIAAASSHTDLSREFESQPNASSNIASVQDIGGSFTPSTSMDRAQASTNDSANQQQQQRRVSLTTDDLPSATHFRANFTLNNLVRGNRNETSTPLSNSQPGDSMLDRYVSLLDYANTLQGQIQTLTSRYREMLLMSRRGGLIVTDQHDGQLASDQSQESSNDQNQEDNSQAQSSSPGSPTHQLSTVFLQEARIFSQYIPRIMHTYSHVLHALSDFSVDVSNGRLTVATPTMGTVLPFARPVVRSTARQTARRSNPPSARPQAQMENTSGPLMERSSVTITATTVDTTPIVSTSTAATTTRQQPQTSATIVVTSDSGQADVHIPISIPLVGSFEPRDIHFNFSTPQVPPPTQEHSRDSSASRQRESNQQSASDEQNNQQRQQQQQRRQETTSTQTSSAARPFGIVTGHLPPPFDTYLICSSPFATSSGPNRGQARQSIGVVPEARVQFRVPTMRSMSGAEPQVNQTQSQATQQGAAPNPTLNAGLTEVVNNILESIFRPADGQPASQSGPTQTSQDNNQSGQSNHDPILNMIPELAINAATQMLSGVLGIQTQQQQPRSTTNANQQQSQPRTRAQVPVMMDIDIDDSSSSQSESRYHDASDSNRSVNFQNIIAPQQQQQQQQSFSINSQPPTTSRQATSSSSLSTRRPVVTSGQRINYDREQLVEVMRNHPDWLPIIEADINLMEQQLESGIGSPTYFSDAYLSSVPRKRRRLLTATPDRVLILQPSPSEAITNLLRRAVTNSRVLSDIESLESIFSSIANDQELQAAYEDHIKSAVEARLRSDCDYKPEKFENSRKYFNP